MWHLLLPLLLHPQPPLLLHVWPQHHRPAGRPTPIVYMYSQLPCSVNLAQSDDEDDEGGDDDGDDGDADHQAASLSSSAQPTQ